MSNGIAAGQLKAIIERLEHVNAERDELASDFKDILAEAKANGFDVPTIRTIIKMRKKDATEREEQEALLDLYLAALGHLTDTPLGNAAMEREGLRDGPSH